jgi:hypothetical protein
MTSGYRLLLRAAKAIERNPQMAQLTQMQGAKINQWPEPYLRPSASSADNSWIGFHLFCNDQ